MIGMTFNHSKINIESYGTYPSTGNHSYFISFWIEDSNTQLEELPTRIIIWESHLYDVNPATDMNDKDREDYIREHFADSIILTGEMQNSIDEFNEQEAEERRMDMLEYVVGDR